MKNLLIFLALIASLLSFGQEAENEPDYFKLRPYIVNGIDFIQSDSLKTIYGTNSKYFFGGGLEFRSSDLTNLRFITQYTYSSLTYAISDSLADTLITNKLLFGFVFPFYEKEKLILTSTFGMNFTKVNETNYYINSSKNIGIQIGFGLERKLLNTDRVFFN